MPSSAVSDSSLPPLEQFVRDYVEVIGGAWDLVEPRVYDVLLPSQEGASPWEADPRGMLRIAFDPEALPEHPGAQLGSFGSPLIDGWLGDAICRGRSSQLYVVGLNLAPHDLAGRVRRAITMPPELELRVARIRALEFPQAVFWFQATFVTDQKEQEIMPVAIDLHYLRQVRHLEQLLDRTRLAEQPSVPMPEIRRSSVAAAYPIAQDRVVRTLAALANTRSRELSERTSRQITRMTQYYADLRIELEEQRTRAENRQEDLSKFPARREALDREERVRIAELRQKSTLWVNLRLLNLLVIRQPKLLLRARLVRCVQASNSSQRTPAERRPRLSAASATPEVSGLVDLVWDPLTESLEAVPCPECHRPTYALDLTRQRVIACTTCASATATQPCR
ncbi:MAG: hypothetical protein HY000_40455 [Planctomycetes bacterium]|nr:hypothetical protein [Planctomycetota bacterium]